MFFSKTYPNSLQKGKSSFFHRFSSRNGTYIYSSLPNVLVGVGQPKEVIRGITEEEVCVTQRVTMGSPSTIHKEEGREHAIVCGLPSIEQGSH